MSSPARPNGRADIHLLLVEDNEADARLVREMLGTSLSGRFELRRARTLAAGCKQAIESGTACVLLDLTLPDGEGMEVVTRMQAAAPGVPVVVLTGRDDERLGLAAVRQGAQDYLTKGRADGRLLTRSIRYAIERKRAEMELTHQALHDPLTGLPNRTLFLDRLEQALARSERRPTAVAVLFLDLDRFKVINDSLGHEAGDRLLVDLARRLGNVLRPGDTVARFGGDEFTILCDEIEGERDAAQIAERVADAVSARFVLEQSEAFLTASIGIAIEQGPEARADSLIRDADAAMYRAKERGPSRYEMFDEVMRGRAIERLETETALHRAVDRGEFRLHYQPIVELETGALAGVEALVRWNHPQRGLIAPDDYIALAEETGLILPLGEWVLGEACRQWKQWREEAGVALPSVSVNLSPRQLAQADLVEVVAKTLRDTQMDRASLCLEITESALLDDVEGGLVALEALKRQGVSVGLDDFGTGYASLSLLKRLPVDLLKVDRSFVSGLGRNVEDLPIVAAVVGLANRLGLAAVAEGVETADQVAELRSMGCRYAQGFYFGRPQPPERLTALIGELSGVPSEDEPVASAGT